VALPDYDAFPLIEEVVTPHHVVDPILGEGEHEIHDRESSDHARAESLRAAFQAMG
jgi:hypothetical protein